MAVRMLTSGDGFDLKNLPPDITLIPAGSSYGNGMPLFLRTTHTGLVLKTGERNGYHDSDFTVTVWDPVKGMPETFDYATTRGWTYPNSATVDATPEVLAAYDAWRKETARKAAERRAERDAKVPSVGRTVKVVKGRKVPKGGIGRVFWFGEDRFYRSYGPTFMMDTLDMVEFGKYRIGVELDGARVFTNAKNVEVVAG